MGYANKEERFIAELDYSINGLRANLQNNLSHINDNAIGYIKEILQNFGGIYERIDLCRRTYDFTKRQLQIVAEYEKELQKLEQYIKNSYDQYWRKSEVKSSEDEYNYIVRYYVVASSDILNKNYRVGHSLYNDLVNRIQTINDFQCSESWKYLDAEKQKFLISIKEKMMAKKTAVDNKGTGFFSSERKAALLVIVWVLVLIASIIGC